MIVCEAANVFARTGAFTVRQRTPADHVTMTSSAVTLKRHSLSVRRRRMMISPVSINGTTAVSCRRAVGEEDTRLTRSKTAVGDFSTQARPVALRTVTRTSCCISASSSLAPGSAFSLAQPLSHQLPPLLLQPSFDDPAGLDLSSSRMSSAAVRASKFSPSDIVRLADDKLDHHRAVAAAAARRRFVLMTVGKTTRSARWKNLPVSAGEMEERLELSPSSTSLPTVSDGACALRYTTSVDLSAPSSSDTRLAKQPFFAA